MATKLRRIERGDTIVEMIFAFAIFSLILIGILTIMNTGVSISQQSVEETLVRQQIDAQAEMIRFMHDTNDPAWATLTSNVSDNIMPLSSSSQSCPSVGDISGGGQNAFFVTQASGGGFTVNSISGSTYASPGTYAQIDYGGGKAYGIWLQIAKAENKSGSSSVGSTIDAYDLYIHACWSRVGSGVPATLGTIVRLYDQKYAMGGPTDDAELAQHHGCSDPATPCSGSGGATTYTFNSRLTVTSSVPATQIAGCSWYWDDDSDPGPDNVTGSEGCTGTTPTQDYTRSHNYENDSHMKLLQPPSPRYPFPEACKPGRYDGATGTGAHTYTVYVVIHKLGGGDVTAAPISVTRPACAA